MNLPVVLPALTSILALVFALALFDQWRERRGGFQLIWALGMLFYGDRRRLRGAGRGGRLERGAVPDVVPDRAPSGPPAGSGWARRSCSAGRASATASPLCLFLAGLFTFLVRNKPDYAGRRARCRCCTSSRPGLLALAVAVETYFANERWPIARGGRGRRGDRPERRPDGDDDAAGARLRGRPGDRCAGGDAVPARSSGC